MTIDDGTPVGETDGTPPWPRQNMPYEELRQAAMEYLAQAFKNEHEGVLHVKAGSLISAAVAIVLAPAPSRSPASRPVK
jgi:hypothetical protein